MALPEAVIRERQIRGRVWPQLPPPRRKECGNHTYYFSNPLRVRDPTLPELAGEWSGRWESNPRGMRFRAFKTSGLAGMLTPSVISV
jgi:hypothetical protein